MDTIFPPIQPFVPVRGTDAVFPVRRIFCIGFNYASHNREMERKADAKPVFFAKPADAVVWADARRGDQAPVIPYPLATKDFHHEVELVVALGEGASVYGHAVGIDLTRRDLQHDAKDNGAPWDMAKGFDHSAPIGDIVRVADAIPAPDAAIWLKRDEQEKQNGRLSEMITRVPDILSALAGFVELKAGDLIFTGTPEGVGPLQPGSHVRAGIAGLGEVAFAIG